MCPQLLKTWITLLLQHVLKRHFHCCSWTCVDMNNTSEMLAQTLAVFSRTLLQNLSLAYIIAYVINIHGKKTITGLSLVFPFEVCTILPGRHIFPSRLRNPEAYLPEKGIFHQCKFFSASRRTSSVLNAIQRRCLCLVFVPPLLASDVSGLSSEPLHFSTPFLSRTASASWIWPAPLPGHCSGCGQRGFLDPLCLPQFFQIKQGWTSASGACVKPVPFIYAHTHFSWMR